MRTSRGNLNLYLCLRKSYTSSVRDRIKQQLSYTPQYSHTVRSFKKLLFHSIKEKVYFGAKEMIHQLVLTEDLGSVPSTHNCLRFQTGHMSHICSHRQNTHTHKTKRKVVMREKGGGGKKGKEREGGKDFNMR